MNYRVRLAIEYERNLSKATAIQERTVEWSRGRAADVLTLPSNYVLDPEQRWRLRTLGTSLFALGRILCDQGKAECVERYLETISYMQRIEDKSAEAITQLSLGHAYMEISAIRNLDAAELAYERSLDLSPMTDALGRSKSTQAIGIVHHERFHNARKNKEPLETLLSHVAEAEKCYLEALRLCPPDALTALAPKHGQLGNLYQDIGQFDAAREHYERNVQASERIGDRFQAGMTRANIARMYARAAANEPQPSQQRTTLIRAQAYAEAALRDYQHYEGRASNDEAEVQGLLDQINQALAKLSQ